METLFHVFFYLSAVLNINYYLKTDKFRTVIKPKKFRTPLVSGSPDKINPYMIDTPLLLDSCLGLCLSASCPQWWTLWLCWQGWCHNGSCAANGGTWARPWICCKGNAFRKPGGWHHWWHDKILMQWVPSTWHDHMEVPLLPTHPLNACSLHGFWLIP